MPSITAGLSRLSESVMAGEEVRLLAEEEAANERGGSKASTTEEQERAMTEEEAAKKGGGGEWGGAGGGGWGSIVHTVSAFLGLRLKRRHATEETAQRGCE